MPLCPQLYTHLGAVLGPWLQVFHGDQRLQQRAFQVAASSAGVDPSLRVGQEQPQAHSKPCRREVEELPLSAVWARRGLTGHVNLEGSLEAPGSVPAGHPASLAPGPLKPQPSTYPNRPH